ncbi:MAG: SET domain-containing protein [Pseudorhodoplanes sp.]|nr:MAG: SET domain-containing protein [Pseudorhodoplanes sp.]
MPRKPFRIGRSRTGLGLFATEPIKKGKFIVEYRGRKLTNAEAERREAKGARYMYELNSRWTLDGSSRRNVARYANHSCRPNAESDVVRGHVIIRAIKNIQPDDEITYDYGRDYFRNVLMEIGGCKCVKCLEKTREERRERRLRNLRRKRRAERAAAAAKKDIKRQGPRKPR